MGARHRARVVVATALATFLVGALIVAVTSRSDNGAGASSTYTVVEERETDLGIAAVVSVKADEAPTDVVEDVFGEHDYVRVTMVCEGRDLEADGWVLQGTVDDGKLNVVVSYADVVC